MKMKQVIQSGVSIVLVSSALVLGDALSASAQLSRPPRPRPRPVPAPLLVPGVLALGGALALKRRKSAAVQAEQSGH
jgi:hypothetical protein